MCEFQKLNLNQDFGVYFRFGILNVGGKQHVNGGFSVPLSGGG